MLSLKERADWAVVVGRVAASVTEPRFWGMTGSQARVIRTSKAAVFLALPAADRRNALDTWSLRVGSGPDEGTVCFVEGEFFADPVGCEGKVGDAGRGLADAVVEAWKARRLPGLLRTLNGPWSGFILDGAGGRLLLFHDRWMFHEVYFTQRPEIGRA